LTETIWFVNLKLVYNKIFVNYNYNMPIEIKKQLMPLNRKDDLQGQMRELLKIHYGFKDYRPGQAEVINNILAGKSTVVIMPTGGGKSLCYQLSALILEGITMVISPLIALMKDQVDSLERIGIPATFINSSLTLAECYDRLEKVKNGRFKLLYIAPERFYNNEFKNALAGIKVSLFAIDEAHCISQWGHDFRPSYLKLKEIIKFAGQPPVMALTATATPEVRADIIKQLDLENPEIVITGFSRPNLQFGVIQADEGRKPEYVMDAISSVPGQSGIIYVGTRARADELLSYLLQNNIEAVSYHAGMEAEDRRWVQENFMNGKANVIVATNAFGLGIDKKDIRFVIHYDMPGTVEAYYQEAGRAGRDGRPSFCLMLYNSRDRYLQEFFIKGDNPPPEVILKIYETLLNYNSDKVLITYAELGEMITESMPDMAIGTALKFLEREGYILRSREKAGSAYLKFNSDFDAIVNSLGPRAKIQIEILNKLNGKFFSELKNGWDINFEEAAEIINVKKDSIIRLVRKLSDEGLVEYRPPFRGTEINILKRAELENVDIDFTAHKNKLKKAYEKLDQIEEYVYNFGCRQKYILNYFGEKDVENCGKCDSCLTKNGYLRKHEPPRKKILSRWHRGAAGKKTGNFAMSENLAPKAKLSTKLTQLDTLELYNNGLSIDKIAEQRGLKESTISAHLGYLIEKGLIKNIDKLVAPKQQNIIIKAIKKAGREKLTPIKEELGDKASWDEIRYVVAKMKAK